MGFQSSFGFDCNIGTVRYNGRMKTKTDYSPLEKLIEGLADCLTGESAKRVLDYHADADLQKQVDQLGNKCTEGTLTPDELKEYENLVLCDRFIAIMKSKTRQRLKNREG